MDTTRSKRQALTPAQISLFWRAFSAACRSLGLEGAAREEYRKEVLRSETAKTSLKDLGRTSDFDSVLKRFYIDAGDWEKAAASAVQDHKRLAYLIKVVCLQLMQLKAESALDARAYLNGLFEQAKMTSCITAQGDGYWLDISFADARKVFSMLDTHRRRLLRPWRNMAGFSPEYCYAVDGPILRRDRVDSGYYATVPFVVRCGEKGGWQ